MTRRPVRLPCALCGLHERAGADTVLCEGCRRRAAAKREALARVSARLQMRQGER